MDSNSVYALTLIGVLLIAGIAVIAWVHVRRKRRASAILRQMFGPEYDRAVNELGNRKAEVELTARQKRVSRLDIVPLAAGEAARFREAWNALQARFVDDPGAAVVEADRLVCELMTTRGYPMGDFEARAADISVDHAGVVSNYRAAKAIALADERGQADTELRRRAVVHFRALFDELLEVREADRHEPPVEVMPVAGRFQA
jgi:hypothetical protein